MKPQSREITQLLIAWHNGDPRALDRLMERVYDELRRIARRHLGRQREGHALQPSDLVNEAFTHLFDQRHVEWQNRAHFYAFAATVMRNILVDHARRKKNHPKVSLSEAGEIRAPEREADLIELDEALRRLERLDKHLSESPLCMLPEAR
ncbi:MAG: ECF-type sigma factor [Blastocatellia bacterium]